MPCACNRSATRSLLPARISGSDRRSRIYATCRLPWVELISSRVGAGLRYCDVIDPQGTIAREFCKPATRLQSEASWRIARAAQADEKGWRRWMSEICSEGIRKLLLPEQPVRGALGPMVAKTREDADGQR